MNNITKWPSKTLFVTWGSWSCATNQCILVSQWFNLTLCFFFSKIVWILLEASFLFITSCLSIDSILGRRTALALIWNKLVQNLISVGWPEQCLHCDSLLQDRLKQDNFLWNSRNIYDKNILKFFCPQLRTIEEGNNLSFRVQFALKRLRTPMQC